MDWLITIKSISGWIAGAFGSALALFFSREKVSKMQRWEIIFIFIAGLLISHWGGGAIVEYFKIPIASISADGVKMTIGMIGMGIFAKLHETAPAIFSKWTSKWM